MEISKFLQKINSHNFPKPNVPLLSNSEPITDDRPNNLPSLYQVPSYNSTELFDDRRANEE